MSGVSLDPGQLWSEEVDCGMASQPAFNNTGSCYARAADPFDNRGDADKGWDWDQGS